MRNRRAYPRMERHQKVKIKVISAPETPHLVGRSFSCSTQDVSVGGIQFSIRRTIPINVTLQLQIEYPQPRRTFDLVGRVVWTRKEEPKTVYRVGVFFTSTPAQALNEWRKMLA